MLGHTGSLFSKLAILTAYQLNDFQIGFFVYRFMNKTLSDEYCAMFTVNVAMHSHNIRQRISDIIVFYCGIRWLIIFLLQSRSHRSKRNSKVICAVLVLNKKCHVWSCSNLLFDVWYDYVLYALCDMQYSYTT